MKFRAVIPGGKENTKYHKFISLFGSFLSYCSLTEWKNGT